MIIWVRTYSTRDRSIWKFPTKNLFLRRFLRTHRIKKRFWNELSSRQHEYLKAVSFFIDVRDDSKKHFGIDLQSTRDIQHNWSTLWQPASQQTIQGPASETVHKKFERTMHSFHISKEKGINEKVLVTKSRWLDTQMTVL